MSVHGEVITSWLSQNELDELTRRFGKPTKPLNHYKGRVYSSPPKEEPNPAPQKTCSKPGCTNKHYGKGYCCSCYNKMKRMGRI